MVLGFLEAFFGSLFIGGRLIGSKVNDAIYKNDMQRREAIMAKLTNREAEKKLGNMAKENGWDWVIQQIPESDLAYVFGTNWAEIIHEYRMKMPKPYNKDTPMFIARNVGYFYCFDDICSILFNILASQNGLVLSERMLNGYQTAYPIGGVEYENRQGVAQRTCRLIESNIRKKHPDIKICLVNNPARNFSLRWDF